MRHRNRGRKLGRNPSHQRALRRNLAAALFLTEGDFDPEFDKNIPKVPGRIVTTLQKAKEVRPLVERCIAIACGVQERQMDADRLGTTAARHSDAWRAWRQSDQWQEWAKAVAPVIRARRRVLQLVGDRRAMQILFDKIAPRFTDRKGGYTRILKLAKPRLGDAGTRAILELVGVRDRTRTHAAQRPSFDEDVAPAAQSPAAASPQAAEE